MLLRVVKVVSVWMFFLGKPFTPFRATNKRGAGGRGNDES